MSSRSSSSSDPDPLNRLAARLGRGDEACIGDLALERGWITESQLMECERDLELGGASGPLDRLLVERGHLSAPQAAELKAAASHRDLDRIASGLAPEFPAEALEASRDPSRRFGRYVLVQEMGQGAMGVVCRAWQTDLGRWVALKRLKVEGTMAVARFLREGRLAARVVHPHLVPIYDMGVVGDEPYLAMALIEGHHLEGIRLPELEALRVIEGVAGAVDAVHAAGILHRDIKPGNLLRDVAGRVFLGDFGLARQEESAPGLSRSGQMIGTPAYASPEQLRGEQSAVGPRSDVYSLGATLFALLMGRPPFPGRDALEVARKVLESEAPLIPGPAGAIVGKAMERDPARRYPSALAFLQDVGRAIAGRPLVARPPSVTHRFRLVLRRRRGLVAGLLGALAVTVALSATLWSQQARWKEEVERERLGRDLEAAWRRAEAAAHGPLEWAESRFRTQLPTDAERAPRRQELRRAIGDLPRHPQVLGALQARFDYLTGDFDGSNRAFDGLIAAHPGDGHILRHRALARLAHALTSIPGPYLSLTAGGSPVVIARRPGAELRRLADSIAADIPHLAVDREGAEALIRGIRAYMDERYAEAAADLEAAARQPSVSSAALEVLAFSWMARGDFARGLEALDRALQNTPGRADLRRLRAATLAAVGRQKTDPAILEKAIAELDRALEICPTWADTRSFRGTLHLGLGRTLAAQPGDLARACAAYRCAVEDFRLGRMGGDEDAETAINEAAAEMSLAELESALEGRNPISRFQRALGLLEVVEVPDHHPEAALVRSTLHRNRAGLLMILVQRQLGIAPPDELAPLIRRSVAEFTRALDLHPSEPAPLHVYRGVARCLLAGLHERPESLREAMADFDAGTALEPRSVKYRQQIAGSALQAGRWLQDVGILKFGLGHASEAVSLDPSAAASWMCRAELYGALSTFETNGLRAGELAELGARDLDRAVEVQDSAIVRLRRSQLRGRLAHLTESRPDISAAWLAKAREDASRATQLDKDSAEAWFQLGAVLRLQGDRQGAIRCFSAVRTLPTATPDLRARAADRIREIEAEE